MFNFGCEWITLGVLREKERRHNSGKDHSTPDSFLPGWHWIVRSWKPGPALFNLEILAPSIESDTWASDKSNK